MDPILAAALAKAGISVAEYIAGQQNKPESLRQTAYGQELKRLSKEGIYGDRGVSNIIGNAAGPAGSIAQTARTRYAGRLINQNLEGSISGQRGFNEIAANRSRIVSDVARKTTAENELSKTGFKKELALATTEREDQIRDFGQQRRDKLFTGLGSAATTALSSSVPKGPQNLGLDYSLGAGSSSSEIQFAQQALIDAGILDGVADGVWGPKTQQAWNIYLTQVGN